MKSIHEIAKEMTGGLSQAEFMAKFDKRKKGGVMPAKKHEPTDEQRERIIRYKEQLAQKPAEHPISTLSQDELFRLFARIMKHELNKQGREIAQHPHGDKIKDLVRWAAGREGALDPRKGVCLLGATGTGKTFLVDCLRIMNKGSNRGMVKTDSMKVWQGFKAGEQPAILDSPKILFLDDIGAEPTFCKEYGNDIAVMSTVIFNRDRMRGLTIATSNLTPDELADKYGSRTADRMDAMFQFVDMGLGMPSFR